MSVNNIPSARSLYRGDINDAVIKVQKATGVHITKSWWDNKVKNHGSAEDILKRFDQKYPEYVAERQNLKNAA